MKPFPHPFNQFVISFSYDDGDGGWGTIRWRDDRVKVICLLARGGGETGEEEGVQGEAASADVNQCAHPFLFVCILVSSASGKKSTEKKKKAEERRRGNASKAICQSPTSSSPTNICYFFACHIPKGNWWRKTREAAHSNQCLRQSLGIIITTSQ